MPKQQTMRTWPRWISTSAIVCVLTVAGCSSTSTPANVDGVKRTVRLDGLATAQGKTVNDQAKIDGTIARGCATGLVTKASCRKHTDASDARLKELGG